MNIGHYIIEHATFARLESCMFFDYSFKVEDTIYNMPLKYGIIFSSIFQGFGNGNYSMYLAFMRQVILLIPILLIGLFLKNITVVWSGFAIAEAISIPYGIWLYRKIKNNLNKKM